MGEEVLTNQDILNAIAYLDAADCPPDNRHIAGLEFLTPREREAYLRGLREVLTNANLPS